MFNGVQLCIGQSIVVSDNYVSAPDSNGFVIDTNAQGSAALTCNTAASIKSGSSAYVNNASSANFTASGNCNVGFTVP